MLNQSAIRFYDSGSAKSASFAAPGTYSASHAYVLPTGLPVTTSYLSTDTNGTLSWTSSIGGETNTASNLGAGFGLYAQKVGSDLQFKSLIAGTGVSLTSSSLAITMSLSASGEANTASNLGSGFGTFAQKSGVDLQFKSLVAGSGIQITSSSTEISFSTTGSGGDITSASNLGSGEGVFASKNTGILQFKSLTVNTSSLGGVLVLSSSSTEIDVKIRPNAQAVSFFEDWIGTVAAGVLGWTTANNGTGSAATIVSNGVDTTTKAIGVVQLATGTNAAGRVSLSQATNAFKIDAFKNTSMEWRVNVPALSTAAQEFGFMCGFGTSTTTLAQTTGVYFLYNRAVYGDVWVMVTANGGTTTATATATAVSTTNFQKLRIDTVGGASATFYIDGTLVGTLTTNLPTSTQVGLVTGVYKSAGTTSRNVWIDYMDFMGHISGAGR